MSNDAQVGAWVDALAAHNHGNFGAWTARFELDGVQPLEQSAKRLSALGATMGPNGGPFEYVVRFPSLSAREVSTILVDAGAWICSEQRLAPTR